MIEFGEEGVEGGRFPAAGGSSDQDDAVGQLEQFLHDRSDAIGEAEAVERDLLLRQEAQADAFPFDAGDRGHAHVDRRTVEFEVDAPVLRQAFFRDVEPRHDLQAGDDGGLQRFDVFRHRQFFEATVNAVADAQPVVLRFDVDVRGTLVEAATDDLVHETDDGGLLVLRFIQHGDFIPQFFGCPVGTTAQDLLKGVRTQAIELL